MGNEEKLNNLKFLWDQAERDAEYAEERLLDAEADCKKAKDRLIWAAEEYEDLEKKAQVCYSNFVAEMDK